MTMKTSLLKVAGALLGALALNTVALALPISGQIHIDATGGSTVALNFAANTVNFSPSAPSTNAKVSFADGTYTGFLGSLVTYHDFNYGAAPGAVAPITIWNLGGSAHFVLNWISSITEIPGVGLLLEGSGMAYETGYSPTAGDWSFSANKSKTKFTFASTTNVIPVPESGMSAVLLGLGLVGVGLAGWRSRKSA